MTSVLSEQTQPNAEIRRATPDDASQIASLLRSSFAEYEVLYTTEAFSATVSSPELICERMREGPVWVAVQSGRVVGTVSAVRKATALYIRGMAVAPVARGRKIGRELLQRAEEFATGEGLKRLFLSTTPFLSGAIRLYEREGFFRTEEGPHELFGTPLFTMVKILGS